MGSPVEMHFITARDLLEYLSPLNSAWNSGTHIFRGQGSDQYRLTPSICRRGKGSFAHGSPRKAFSHNYKAQVQYELMVLRQFLLGCDRAGLAVPGYSEQTKASITNTPNIYLSASNPWPQPQMYEMLAVAQHYDVPTRLLDWTERSFVACYFAAASANFVVNSHLDRIAIWALDTSHSKDWKTVKIIRTPGGTSKNQAAQSGLFTTHITDSKRFTEIYQPEALEEVDEIYGESGEQGTLIKMTLPVLQAPALLELCSKLGVDASTLFPGHSGVAQSVRDWAKIEVGVTPTDAFRNDYYGNLHTFDSLPTME